MADVKPMLLPVPLDGKPVTAHLSLDPGLDHLIVVKMGVVWDGQPEHLSGTFERDERFGYLLNDDGEIIGFGVEGPPRVDVEEIDLPEIWVAPRFHVPVLGATNLTIGEILLLVQARYSPDEATTDVLLFDQAVGAIPEDPYERPTRDQLLVALDLWRRTLEAGNMKAHFGLGYTYHDLGMYPQACEHLRFYTELTPGNSWAWVWLGKACAALGNRREAASAFRRAIELEEQGSFETDADELLAELGPGFA